MYTLNSKGISQLEPIYAINFIEYKLEYSSYLEKSSKRMGYSIEGLNAFIYSLKEVAKNSKDIPSFFSRLTELQEIMEYSKFNKRKNAVTLSTIHSAKGLEFESVLMIDLIEGIIPAVTFTSNTIKDMSILIFSSVYG